jgi:hypothetical protein
MYEYEEVIELGSKMIKRTDENGSVAWIPLDLTNSDYQRYLNPEAKQSTPKVATK